MFNISKSLLEGERRIKIYHRNKDSIIHCVTCRKKNKNKNHSLYAAKMRGDFFQITYYNISLQRVMLQSGI